MDLAKILIVDDESLNIELLRYALQDKYQIIPVTDAKAVITTVKEQQPDLILLDVVMPDIDGHELCRRLKADDLCKHIPLIFVTGKDAVEDELVGLNLGAVDYFRKPFSIPLIQMRINNQIELLRKTKQLEQMAWIDGLTEISNRRMFDVKLDEASRHAQRYNRQLAVMLIDIDFFKQYNDTYGHGKGDEVLKLVAQTLKSGAGRPFDIVARYGGEEFIILLTEVQPQDGALVGEKVRELIEGLNIEHKNSSIHQCLTISVGVATSNETGKNIDTEALVKTADNNLYEAKNAGRNCVVSSDFRPSTDVSRQSNPR